MKVKELKAICLLTVLLAPALLQAEPIESFSKAKTILLDKVYFDQRVTLYCGAVFDAKKHITLPGGFHTDKHKIRANKVEWEHVVPAENFGRTFSEWRDGDSDCIDSKGKAFKGRDCASKVNQEYRFMQSDLYNLYPAIGAVNAMRSNFNFTMLPAAKASFGTCQMKIDDGKAEPPIEARGRIARTYLYMEERYSRYKMSRSQRQLMTVWDKQFPVTQWECERAKRIQNIQGNENRFVANNCRES